MKLRWLICLILLGSPIQGGLNAVDSTPDQTESPALPPKKLSTPVAQSVDEPPLPDYLKEEEPSPSRPMEERYDFWSEFMSMLGTLAFVIFLMLCVAWFLKRMMRTRMDMINQSSHVKVLEQRTLSPRANLYLIDVFGKGIVIAESAAGVQKVADVPEGIDLSGLAPEPSKKTFTQTFTEKLREDGLA